MRKFFRRPLAREQSAAAPQSQDQAQDRAAGSGLCHARGRRSADSATPGRVEYVPVAYSVPEHVRDDEAMLAHLRSMPLECAEAVARLSAGLCARMTEEARNAGLAGDVAQSQALLMRGGGVAQFLREFCRLREEPGGEDGGEDGGGGAGGALEGGW